VGKKGVFGKDVIALNSLIRDKISFVGALGQSYGSGARRQILFVGALSLELEHEKIQTEKREKMIKRNSNPPDAT